MIAGCPRSGRRGVLLMTMTMTGTSTNVTTTCTTLEYLASGVRRMKDQTKVNNEMAVTVSDGGIKFSFGICGVEPDERKNAPLSSAGTPVRRMLMAVPEATWSALNLMHATA